MATARDAQDILDLKQADASARPKKKGPKPKLVRPAHIPKEVWLLETQGDRAPPVALTAIQPKKPKFARRVKPWEWQAFTHPNRKDGLVLHHWSKRFVASDTQNAGPATPADGAVAVLPENKATQTEPQAERGWAKYNVKVDVPRYTEEQYEKYLEVDDWSKEETDYLISVVEDFDLRWVVIADRYEYKPAASAVANGEDAMVVVPAAKSRSMEDLKARYYKVASAMMAVNQPLSSMTQAEFSFHEKMTKFDAVKEARRKRMAEQLLERNDQEIEEEKRLLAELKRIVQDEDDFIAERQELYERLNAPSTRGGNISMYESSTGLAQLGATLAAQDRNRSRQYQLQQQQRRQLAGLDDKDKSNSPAGPPTAGLPRGGGDSRRSLDGPPAGRKDSKASHATYVQRQLSDREERKYGVQRPEKLLTGEKIRHVRIERRVTARASSVAAKVQDTMVELGLPIKPVMATQRITEGYEQLCASLDLYLDTRRVTDKVENEIKVLKAQKEARENTGGEGQEGGVDEQKAETSLQEDEARAREEDEEQAEQAEAKARAEQEAEEDDEQDEEQEEEEEEEVHQEEREESDDQDEDENGEEEANVVEDEDEDEDEDEEDTRRPEPDDEGTSDEDGAEEEDEEDGNDNNADDGTPDGDGDPGDANGGEDESRPSTRASRKRSLSVLSSAPSQKSTKRQRK